MAREYSPLLVAVLVCIMLTGTVIAYGILMEEVAPPPTQPTPGTPPAPGQPRLPPTPTGTPGTPVMTGAPVSTDFRSFSISVTPTTVTTRPGEQVNFTLTVYPENGFAAPVEIEVFATALGGVYRDTRDLGTVFPPYPPIRYEIITPDLPPLVSTTTVDAMVTASGGGIVQTEQVQMVIRR
ncbi:hypothetical protein [Methanoculleus sp.]|uniref:hypothetical protein n=1 Tax=Methanoculleus sp. TaxID=90427 RepID=UPI0025E24647|nr:hypothetical protein [Methanoculleus sp.]